MVCGRQQMVARQMREDWVKGLLGEGSAEAGNAPQAAPLTPPDDTASLPLLLPTCVNGIAGGTRHAADNGALLQAGQGKAKADKQGIITAICHWGLLLSSLRLPALGLLAAGPLVFEMPGCCWIAAASCQLTLPTRELSRLLLPTFGRPTMATAAGRQTSRQEEAPTSDST